jgi:two-component system response regulator NreC
MFKIFLADDHILVRHGLRRIIEEDPHYKVTGETGDGLEIVSNVRKLRPDMIILDISMPNLRGIEAIRKIRRFDKKILILVLTMHKNDEYVYECLVNGAQGYILKEDADNELMSAITTVKNGELYISPSFASDVIKKLIQRKAGSGSRRQKTAFKELTHREREVLKLIAEGNPNKKIARKLGISVRTVEHHRLSITKKLGITNTASLVKHAIEIGLLDLSR